jgi:hypothetical protein
VPKLPSFDAQAFGNTAWALATLDYHDAAFMGALLVEAKPKVPGFTIENVTQMSVALKKLNITDANSGVRARSGGPQCPAGRGQVAGLRWVS